MATTTSLPNCIIDNHSSVEFGGDQVNQSTVPSHVVIAIRPNANAAPPDDLGPTQSTEGFWWVRSVSFSISNSTAFNIVNPCGNYVVDGATFMPISTSVVATGTAMNSDSIIQIGVTQVGGDLSQDNQGKLFNIDIVSDTESGVELWDNNVADVMLTDTEKQQTLIPNTGDFNAMSKNMVYCYVRLKDNFIMPGVDETLRVDLSGFAEWQSYSG
tara:strand:- start:7299 stop:7940 length:642 start_codon:yes stop_codon:yes gene_type:complete